MGKTFTALIPLLLAACSSRPVTPAVAPSLPPAAFHQITILDPGRSVVGTPDASHLASDTPGVIDLREALKATPEAREMRARSYLEDVPEYHVLLARANERLQTAIRRVCSRRSIGVLMERGSVVLKPEITHVQVADITEEVAYEVRK